MDAAGLAQLSQSLKDNEAVYAIITSIRSDALESLATVKVTDIEKIHHLQAIVKVVDDFYDMIDAYIRAAMPRKQAGIV